VCYDGNHRREAFHKSNLKDDQAIIIDVICNAETEDVFESFNAINKSVPVPALYLEEHNPQIMDEIRTLSRKYAETYKPFLSTSSNCHAPNFNRDSLEDQLFKIWQDYSGEVSVNQSSEALVELNQRYARGEFPAKLNGTVTTKCTKYGFWLFRLRVLNRDHISFVICRASRATLPPNSV
jgi:hypothetical protein